MTSADIQAFAKNCDHFCVMCHMRKQAINYEFDDSPNKKTIPRFSENSQFNIKHSTVFSFCFSRRRSSSPASVCFCFAEEIIQNLQTFRRPFRFGFSRLCVVVVFAASRERTRLKWVCVFASFSVICLWQIIVCLLFSHRNSQGIP